MKKFDLSGKTALVTGAAGLLGREHAAALMEVGANVVLTDVNLKPLKVLAQQLMRERPAGKVMTFAMDVTSEVSIQGVESNLSSLKYSVDVLVNNAAIDPKAKPGVAGLRNSRLEFFSIDDWDTQIDVGLKGAFLCSRIFGKKMSEAKGGVILNIASDLSLISPDQRIYRRLDTREEDQPVKPITYSAIKTGLIGLTRYLATYWADKGVRVNALSPGGVDAGLDEVFVSKVTQLIPLRRMARPDEYRSAVQFLCSDASSYMTGHNLVMDGGRTIW